MSNYDKYYKKENYFGKPYTELLDFFASQDKGSLVDLGAGQGRNSIFLANQGYNMTAIDISKVGIQQIMDEIPKINGLVADIHTFDISKFDYILTDSMFHFYKNDTQKESMLVTRILREMKPKAIFVNCMVKSKKAEKCFHEAVIKAGISSTTIYENYINTGFNAKYHMIAIKKD